MVKDRDSTRRTFLKTGAGALGASLLAGCAGGDGGDGEGGDANSSDQAKNDTTNGTSTSGGQETPYSVEIAPVGKVTFDQVPKTWVANNGSWADMGIALGQEPPKGVWLTSRYHTQYYDDIPGVSVDKSGMVSLYQDSVGKEQFYKLDGDVHVIDPNFLMNRFKGWERKDVDEIAKNVAPFFGNSIFSRGYPWHEDYRYYSLMEAFEKLAQVFQQQERYEAFEAVHETFQANLAPVVPGRKERPSVAVVWGSGDAPEKFYPYTIGEGTSFKHLRDLKVKDALANTSVKNFHESRGAIDFETLLEVDPEVLLIRGQEAKSAEEFQKTVVQFMKGHEVASELTAVKNGDVYRAGGLYQGPITNLVLTERLAADLYGSDAKLYDRKRVADIVNGDF
ncbi:ABC transporter substrate-binding protein [Halomarina pelagica]|uniref:ABC transporter substrate-binding protein n=1 Tax=Halomarina pelagica TaxID=2961599 RepID=UPI0020C2228E|nr:ABC transporter substrate-binding protein [Halomarina sp. BND7]